MRPMRCSYQLHIQLCDTKPAVWRRVLVAGSTPLAQLHQIIQAAMGWNDCHAYQFEIAGQSYGIPNPDWPEDPTMDARRYTLGQLLQGQALPIRYRYDFGDDWLHRIKIEACLPLDGTVPEHLPLCLAGRNACPPEDCGGPFAYAELLAALQDAAHPAHRAARRRYGNFDARLFDLLAAQQRMQDLQPPAVRNPYLRARQNAATA